jgi:integrase
MAETLRWYRRELLARLGGDPNGDLFVSQGGERKCQDTFADQIIERIETKVGIHMTPHQFRHLAAVLYLEAHPEDFQTVSDLLGHAFAKTTRIYAGSSTRRASVTYGKHLVEQRQAALLRQRRRRRPK